MATKIDFESLSREELQALVAEASSILAAKTEARRRELQAELAALDDGIVAPENGNRIGNGKLRGPAPVKYRDDKGNTWTERGNTPKWLLAYEAQGRKREEFLVKE